MPFSFEKLDVYQEAVQLGKDVLRISAKEKSRGYRYLFDQVNKASLSVSLNIAEGSGRSKKQFSHFLDIARCSLYECIPLFRIMLSEQILTQEEFDNFYEKCEILAKRVNALKRSLKAVNREP